MSATSNATNSGQSSSSMNFGIANPMDANLTDLMLSPAGIRAVTCFINATGNNYNGHLGARISSIFVIGFVSTFFTFFPVVARRVPRFRIPLYVYLFARYFGAGVIVATAFIHLLDPAYSEIGPQTCVGLTNGWNEYSWPPAITLVSVMFIFMLDFAAERYVENKYGVDAEVPDVQGAMTGKAEGRRSSAANGQMNGTRVDDFHADEHRKSVAMIEAEAEKNYAKKFDEDAFDITDSVDEEARRFAVQQQIAAFLILEFGVIFHSVIIGLNLGVSGPEFSTLYAVLVFHQSFEGLGIGARLSAIPFKKGSWIPWALCSAYGVTTPLAIAIGLGLRTTYNSGSFTANVVSGVLDSISAGILIYTGLVELLARDFLFNPVRTKDSKRLTFMMCSVLLGAAIMALLGKWA